MQKAIKRYFPVFVLPTLIAFTIRFGIKNTVRKILVPLIFFVKSIATANAKMLINNTVTIVNNAVNQRE